MAFGQQSGPPASAKEIAHLEALLGEAGYSSFREARHIYGLTQRQAGGKFSRDEASTLIDQLLQGDAEVIGSGNGPSMEQDRAARQLEQERIQLLQGTPADLLADELRRRGWTVTEP